MLKEENTNIDKERKVMIGWLDSTPEAQCVHCVELNRQMGLLHIAEEGGQAINI